MGSPRSPRGMASPKMGMPPTMVGQDFPGPIDMLSNGGLIGVNPGAPSTGALAKGARGRHRSESGGDTSQFVLNIEAVRMGNEVKISLFFSFSLSLSLSLSLFVRVSNSILFI